MKTSQQGLDLIIAREGMRTKVYLDTVGVATVGIGHTGPEVRMGEEWTPESCRNAFARDIEKFEKAITEAVKVPLEQHQFDALVSWAFNVGTGAAKASTLVKYLNLGNMEAAANAFDSWHIPASIITRRNAEREQFKGTALEARIP